MQTYSSGLGLGDQIASRNSRTDSTLLDSGWLFKTVGVDTTKKFFGQFHAIKGFNYLIPVGVDVGIGQSAIGSAFGWCIIWWGVAAKKKRMRRKKMRQKNSGTKYFLSSLNLLFEFISMHARVLEPVYSFHCTSIQKALSDWNPKSTDVQSLDHGSWTLGRDSERLCSLR